MLGFFNTFFTFDIIYIFWLGYAVIFFCTLVMKLLVLLWMGVGLVG